MQKMTQAPRVKVFVLSHLREGFESVPDCPELERVLLGALPLAPELQTNLIGEGRAFLADLDAGDAEYVGYMNARAPAKYQIFGSSKMTWQKLRRRLATLQPGVVLAPWIAAPTWAAASEDQHPGMLDALFELRDVTGLCLDTGRPSLWANDMVMHRSVWSEWLLHWRRCFAHFHGRYGWDWPVPEAGLDAERKPAYFAERWTTLFFANRDDLVVEQL